MSTEPSITVTRSRRGYRLRCDCGCLDVPDVVESEVGMLTRIHFDASHLTPTHPSATVGPMTHPTIDDQIDTIYDTLHALATHPAVSSVEYRSILASVVERCTDDIDRIDGARR